MKASVSLVVVGMLIAGATAQPAEAAGRLKVHRAGEGAIRAELSYRQIPDSHYWKRGRFRIWNRGQLVVERRIPFGAVIFGRRPIAVRQLDGTGQPEVLLTEFSGGNGCCWTHWIYAGARRIRAPWKGPPAIRDGDGDGKPEFHGREPSWALWGARAWGRSPVKVWTYSARAVQEVTRSFPAEVQADQADHYAAFQQDVAAGNGTGARNGLAAYVADGYTLGQGEAAMAVLQAAVDAGQLDDPGSETSTAEYVDQLRALLRERGYTTQLLDPLAPHALSPSELKRGGCALTVGRRPEVDLSIAWDDEVSGLHPELQAIGGEWTIVDDGDRVRVGRTTS